MRSPVTTRTAILAATLTALAGCGGAKSGQDTPVVSAATSLKAALTSYARTPDGGGARLSFGGSDELAAQIRQGVRPDVFASANTKLPDALFREGLVERPSVFATNRLVLAVPASGGRVRSLADLYGGAAVTIAIGAPGVPIGDYTRKVLARLPAARRSAILRRVRSEEPDVGGIVGKLAQGAVDAGFVYVTDVRAAGGRLRAIELPARLQPSVRYGVAVVRGAPHPGAARRFAAGLLRAAGARALRVAGFGPP
jgi:molybdate transport system substrate-binding protein